MEDVSALHSSLNRRSLVECSSERGRSAYRSPLLHSTDLNCVRTENPNAQSASSYLHPSQRLNQSVASKWDDGSSLNIDKNWRRGSVFASQAASTLNSGCTPASGFLSTPKPFSGAKIRHQSTVRSLGRELDKSRLASLSTSPPRSFRPHNGMVSHEFCTSPSTAASAAPLDDYGGKENRRGLGMNLHSEQPHIPALQSIIGSNSRGFVSSVNTYDSSHSTKLLSRVSEDVNRSTSILSGTCSPRLTFGPTRYEILRPCNDPQLYSGYDAPRHVHDAPRFAVRSTMPCNQNLGRSVPALSNELLEGRPPNFSEEFRNAGNPQLKLGSYMLSMSSPLKSDSSGGSQLPPSLSEAKPTSICPEGDKGVATMIHRKRVDPSFPRVVRDGAFGSPSRTSADTGYGMMHFDYRMHTYKKLRSARVIAFQEYLNQLHQDCDRIPPSCICDCICTLASHAQGLPAIWEPSFQWCCCASTPPTPLEEKHLSGSCLKDDILVRLLNRLFRNYILMGAQQRCQNAAIPDTSHSLPYDRADGVMQSDPVIILISVCSDGLTVGSAVARPNRLVSHQSDAPLMPLPLASCSALSLALAALDSCASAQRTRISIKTATHKSFAPVLRWLWRELRLRSMHSVPFDTCAVLLACEASSPRICTDASSLPLLPTTSTLTTWMKNCDSDVAMLLLLTLSSRPTLRSTPIISVVIQHHSEFLLTCSPMGIAAWLRCAGIIKLTFLDEPRVFRQALLRISEIKENVPLGIAITDILWGLCACCVPARSLFQDLTRRIANNIHMFQPEELCTIACCYALQVRGLSGVSDDDSLWADGGAVPSEFQDLRPNLQSYCLLCATKMADTGEIPDTSTEWSEGNRLPCDSLQQRVLRAVECVDGDITEYQLVNVIFLYCNELKVFVDSLSWLILESAWGLIPNADRHLMRTNISRAAKAASCDFGYTFSPTVNRVDQEKNPLDAVEMIENTHVMHAPSTSIDHCRMHESTRLTSQNLQDGCSAERSSSQFSLQSCCSSWSDSSSRIKLQGMSASGQSAGSESINTQSSLLASFQLRRVSPLELDNEIKAAHVTPVNPNGDESEGILGFTAFGCILNDGLSLLFRCIAHGVLSGVAAVLYVCLGYMLILMFITGLGQWT